MKVLMNSIIAVATVLTVAGVNHQAEAGGLFGCSGSGALIRGSVGCTVKKKVNPVATPLLRKGVELGTTAIGKSLGGPIGGFAGKQVGRGINNVAAGRDPFGNKSRNRVNRSRVTQVRQHQPVFSNRCFTNIGIAQIYPQQVGTRCQAQHISGYWYQGIVR